jgi:hypothetical protein
MPMVDGPTCVIAWNSFATLRSMFANIVHPAVAPLRSAPLRFAFTPKLRFAQSKVGTSGFSARQSFHALTPRFRIARWSGLAVETLCNRSWRSFTETCPPAPPTPKGAVLARRASFGGRALESLGGGATSDASLYLRRTHALDIDCAKSTMSSSGIHTLQTPTLGLPELQYSTGECHNFRDSHYFLPEGCLAITAWTFTGRVVRPRLGASGR